MLENINFKKVLIVGNIILLIVVIIISIIVANKRPDIKDKIITTITKGNSNSPKNTYGDIKDISKNESETENKVDNIFFEEYFKEKYPSITKDEISKKIFAAKKNDLATARKILYWILSFRKLEKMPASNNITLYHLSVVCDKKDCRAEGPEKQVSIPIIFTTWEIYRKTGDKALLNVFKKDIELLEDQTFQTDYLHCFFTEKLKQYNSLEEKYKQKLSKICRNSRKYILNIQESSPYAEKLPVSLTDFSFNRTKSKIEGKVFETKSTSYTIPADDYMAFLYATHAVEMISMAKEFNSRFYTQLSRYYYDMSFEYLAKKPEMKSKTKIYPYLSIASLLLSEETISKEYKSMFYYLSPLAMKTNRNSTEQLIHIAFFEDIAFEKTGNQIYKTDIINILKYLKNNKLDKNGIKSDNKYTVDNKFIYPVRENIIFAYLLSKYENL